MAERRYYPAGVEEALHLLSGGSWYRPDCGEPTIRFLEGEPKKNVVVAHIHAFEKNGPREIPDMTRAERNSFPNLILLCVPCHNTVDHNVAQYTAKVLKEWKAGREKEPTGSLAGLRGLDRDGMESLLNKAMSELRQDMADVAEKFPELASLMQHVIENIPRLDPDAIAMLTQAARRLDLPEHVPMLAQAARRLDLPDYAPLLLQAARLLTSLPDTLDQLNATSRNLRELPDHARQLDAAVQRFDEKIVVLNGATNSVADAVRDAQGVPVQELSVHVSDWYWKAMLIGWAGWVVVILIAVVYFANNKA